MTLKVGQNIGDGILERIKMKINEQVKEALWYIYITELSPQVKAFPENQFENLKAVFFSGMNAILALNALNVKEKENAMDKRIV